MGSTVVSPHNKKALGPLHPHYRFQSFLNSCSSTLKRQKTLTFLYCARVKRKTIRPA